MWEFYFIVFTCCFGVSFCKAVDLSTKDQFPLFEIIACFACTYGACYSWLSISM